MLKLSMANARRGLGRQPPSGGCVLKPISAACACSARWQPPSGGCVLKLVSSGPDGVARGAAAFGRLCVETGQHLRIEVVT